MPSEPTLASAPAGTRCATVATRRTRASRPERVDLRLRPEGEAWRGVTDGSASSAMERERVSGPALPPSAATWMLSFQSAMTPPAAQSSAMRWQFGSRRAGHLRLRPMTGEQAGGCARSRSPPEGGYQGV
jgi:hypothetical protein